MRDARTLRRRIRGVSETFSRKFFDGFIVFALVIIIGYVSRSDWPQYRSIIQINIDRHGLVGFGHSQYIRGYALTNHRVSKVPGKVVFNGPLNPNHKAIGISTLNDSSAFNDHKFLLPLQQVGLKIHQVINSLRDSIILAKRLNRTLVLPPLLHVTSKKHTNDFEVNETTITAWDSWRTLDTGKLSLTINMIGIHQYRDICGKMNGLQTVFACQRMSNIKNNHYRFQEVFREIWGFEPLGLMDLNGTIEMSSPAAVISTQRKNDEKMELDDVAKIFEDGGKCATLVYPHSCYTFRANEWAALSQNFRLHPRVRSISEGFSRKVLKGKTFAIARMDFSEDCSKFLTENRETSPNPSQWDNCKTVQELSTEEISKKFEYFMKEKKLGFIYFTSPIGFEEERVKKICQTLPEKTGVTFGDLANYIRTNKPALINSTVDFSLAEVDMAFRADFFIGSQMSEWSRMVTVDRTVNSKNGDISLLKYLAEGKEDPIQVKEKTDSGFPDTL